MPRLMWRGRPDRSGSACCLPKTGQIAAQTEYLANGTFLAMEERKNTIMGQPAELIWLDEPLAGLAEADRQVSGRLIRRLADSQAVLLIEHDIDRVLTLSDRITVLHQGRLIADGKPAKVGRNPNVVTVYLGAERIVPPPAPTEADRAVHAAASRSWSSTGCAPVTPAASCWKTCR